MKRTGITRKTGLRRTGRLPFRSKKTAKVYREQRVPLVKALTADGPTICPVAGCTRIADSPHEPLTRARGGSITDPANVVLVCWPHNVEISADEPDWAYEQGLLKHSWEAS